MELNNRKGKTMTYEKWLDNKRTIARDAGFELPESFGMTEGLKDWQSRCVRFALRKGRSALFADTGLGKTFMQLEWARIVASHCNSRVLILAPLAVAAQTVREGAKWGIHVVQVDHQSGVVCDGIYITNYDRADQFEMGDFSGIVLDESSIIKSFTGATTKDLTQRCSVIPYRLCCSATPSPNDHVELGTHAEFLGIMSRVEMLATYFVHDGGDTSKWRLKGHAEQDFWRWCCSWAISISKPSDIGGDDTGYNLPPLEIIQHIVKVDQSIATEGMLFRSPDLSATGLHKEMRLTAAERAAEVASIIDAEPDEKWIVWCNTDYEADELKQILPTATAIHGSTPREKKIKLLERLGGGELDIVVTKPSVAGIGLNLQHSARMAFVGLSYSYEQFYQAVRREWRYGQTRKVVAHIVIAETEGAVLDTIRRKQRDHEVLKLAMNTAMREVQLSQIGTARSIPTYDVAKADDWKMTHGDCVKVMQSMDDESIHYSIFSPPFASLYTYSDAEADMGNCRDHAEFFQHMRFMVRELFRVLKSGRLVSFHCMNLPKFKERDGVIGITDFRGKLIALFEEFGFIFHSEVCIWKDPVTAMQRTKAIGLLYKQLRKDSCMSRQGIPDYLVTMRKPGENADPVTKIDPTIDSDACREFPVGLWQNYASPVWMDINPSDTLQRESAREERDERHICPLQLEVIRRGIRLWTNVGDVVFSPFAGIGSEGFVAIQMARNFVGVELKRSYFEQACLNIKSAESHALPLLDEAIA